MSLTPRLIRRLLIALCVVPLAPGGLTAQRVARRSEVPAALTLVREGDLKRDLYTMASAAMRGREGGTIDEMQASAWVADQYRQIGLALSA